MHNRRFPALAMIALGTALALPAEATRVTFRFRPPEPATVISVAGTFNDWNPGASLLGDADGDGTWETILDLPPGRHLYKFVAEGTTWYTDETAAEFVDDGFGGKNSVLLLEDEPVVVGEAGETELLVTGTEITFRYRLLEPTVNSVSLAGTFNDWNAASHPLRDEDGNGVWEITLRIEPGDHGYQFVLDGERWVGDPSATRFEADGFGGRNARFSVRGTPLSIGP